MRLSVGLIAIAASLLACAGCSAPPPEVPRVEARVAPAGWTVSTSEFEGAGQVPGSRRTELTAPNGSAIVQVDRFSGNADRLVALQTGDATDPSKRAGWLDLETPAGSAIGTITRNAETATDISSTEITIWIEADSDSPIRVGAGLRELPAELATAKTDQEILEQLIRLVETHLQQP